MFEQKEFVWIKMNYIEDWKRIYCLKNLYHGKMSIQTYLQLLNRLFNRTFKDNYYEYARIHFA